MATAIDELRREIHKQGYDTEKGRDGHYRVLDAKGEVVRDAGGKPVRFASTPSRGKGTGARSIENAVSRLRRAGVLPRPGQRPPPAATNGNGRGPRSDALRAQLAELIERHGLRQVEVSAYADLLASVRLTPVPSYGQGVVSAFLKGGALSEANLAWLGGATAEIAEAGGIPAPIEPEAAAAPEPEPEREPEPEPPEPEPRPPERRERTPVPSLALDVMQALYAADRDDVRIRALVERVAELEMGGGDVA